MIKKIAMTAGLAAALATGAAAWKSNRNDQAAMDTHPPLGAFITIDGTRIHYLIEGSGPAIVLIHGAGGNMRDFTFELSRKLAKTHTVITYDRPGHGYTDTIHDAGESPMEQAALLKAAIIAGYSFGGAVALAWALDYPNATDGIITMNAVSNPWVIPPSKLYALVADKLTGPIMATSLSAFAPHSLIQDTMQSIFAPRPTPDGYLDYIGRGPDTAQIHAAGQWPPSAWAAAPYRSTVRSLSRTDHARGNHPRRSGYVYSTRHPL